MKRWLIPILLALTAFPVAAVGAYGILGMAHAVTWIATCDISCARRLTPAKLDPANFPFWLAMGALLVGWIWVFVRKARRVLAEPNRRVLEIAVFAALFCLFAVCLVCAFHHAWWSLFIAF